MTTDECISIKHCFVLFFKSWHWHVTLQIVCVAFMHIQGLINFQISGKGILSCTHKILHDDTHTSVNVAGSECYQVDRGGSKKTLPCGPQFLARTQRRIAGLTHSKKFIKERTERTPQGRGVPNQEKHWHKNVRCVRGWGQGQYIKDRTFTFSFRSAGLTVLIDIYKLHNGRLYGACLSHNSVHYNQTHVCIEYLWILNSGAICEPWTSWCSSWF